MQKTRAGVYGENLAILIRYIISTIPADIRESYKRRFLKELKNYSFEPRKKGSPRNSGCVYELEGVIRQDIRDPNYLAKLVKEGLHMMYVKDTSARVMRSFLEHIIDAAEPQ